MLVFINYYTVHDFRAAGSRIGCVQSNNQSPCGWFFYVTGVTYVVDV